ncbi:MAG: hypothetical protein FWJ70_03500 [Micromonosporaceae bacterium]
MSADVLAFVAASTVLIVVPGVDFALVTRVAVGYGRRTALVTAGGLLAGGLLHAAFAGRGSDRHGPDRIRGPPRAGPLTRSGPAGTPPRAT